MTKLVQATLKGFWHKKWSILRWT